MPTNTVHNPDRFMADLRQTLSQGRKRIGLLLGAGAPTALKTNGTPLIPDVKGLTEAVLAALDVNDKAILEIIKAQLKQPYNIESLLTAVRKLAEAIGDAHVHGLDGAQYANLASRICREIGIQVGADLPEGENPYSLLVSWIGGTHREHPVEIFTPNYDLLLEQAFERAHLPFFDGFTGSHTPFFDPVSVSTDQLPSRWSRLWKLHGSLGWAIDGDVVVRNGNKQATELIYPEHLKYSQITRLPYSALFERLRVFLTTPDTLLICSGFSFADAHICAVLSEAMTANANTAIFAFQYSALSADKPSTILARTHSNLSLYARDGAVIGSMSGKWQPGQPPSGEWKDIRQTFWLSNADETSGEFLLGDFACLARFFALTHAERLAPPTTPPAPPLHPNVVAAAATLSP